MVAMLFISIVSRWREDDKLDMSWAKGLFVNIDELRGWLTMLTKARG